MNLSAVTQKVSGEWQLVRLAHNLLKLDAAVSTSRRSSGRASGWRPSTGPSGKSLILSISTGRGHARRLPARQSGGRCGSPVQPRPGCG
jgi:hypothetical protein